MKALSAFVGLILLAQVAMAGQNVFTYHRPTVIEQSKSGNICPQLQAIIAVNEPNSTVGRAVHLVDVRGNDAVFIYEATTQTCREDILCESINHYSNSSQAKVAMTVTNDGSYPTTDIPGYKSAKFSWVDPKTSTAKYCVYYFF